MTRREIARSFCAGLFIGCIIIAGFVARTVAAVLRGGHGRQVRAFLFGK